MKKLLIILLFIPVLSFARGSQLKYETTTDIAYYPESTRRVNNYIADRCVLDIYHLKEVKNTPVLIWFHGGGLTGGDKYIPEELKNKGVCVVAIRYRLMPKASIEQCIDDAAAAVAWVFKNIEKYNGDSSLVFVSGHSAGGYLASMVGFDKSWLMKFGADANQIAGLMPLSGQMITHFAQRATKGIPDYRPVVDQYAPMYHIRADAPPVLLITGDREMELLGRYEENAYMMRMLKIAGHNDVQIFELQGFGHDMIKPACPLVIDEINRIVNSRNSSQSR